MSYTALHRKPQEGGAGAWEDPDVPQTKPGVIQDTGTKSTITDLEARP